MNALLKSVKVVFEKLYGSNMSLEDLDKKSQKDYIDKIHLTINPSNLVERSFAQYKAQMFFINTTRKVIINILSFIQIPVFIIIYTLRYLLCFKFKSKKSVESLNVYLNNNYNVIPESLKDDKLISAEEKYLLDGKTLYFCISNLSKYFLYPYFVYKCIGKIALYNYNIKKYNCDRIIATSEYSYTSSILTLYCEKNNCRHVNVMHGDKLYHIVDSFFSFHKCYIWDEFYKELFIELKAEPDQFIVEKPLCIKISPSTRSKEIKTFKYYIGGETLKGLEDLSFSLKEIKDSGIEVVIRYHPIYSDINFVNEMFKDFNIEHPKDIGIIESIGEATWICGLYSTTLLQGYYANKIVIMNDLNETFYNTLKDLDYIGFKLKFKRLSTFLGKQ